VSRLQPTQNSSIGPWASRSSILGSGSVWFFVAAVYDRRVLIQQIPALIERRYSKLTHYRILFGVYERGRGEVVL
jgi:hypothetical protein